ncbi:MAG: HNH endonuclease [Bacteroidia bacterium]|nr:HNH endonuclease [Bacteroidia bacterium]
MERKLNFDRNGKDWSEITKIEVWEKGRVVAYSSEDWRWDMRGNVMKWSEYGNENSEYGWEIGHMDSESDENNNDDNLHPVSLKIKKLNEKLVSRKDSK